MNRDDRMPRMLLAGLLVLTLARLLVAGFNELSEDEAYYFMWSQRLDWSYYSKGPGIAVAMWLSTTLLGNVEIGVRFFSPLLALASSLVMWRLARSMFDARVATWTIVLLNLTPIFNAGALVMTIDPLSIFFWLAAMLFVWRALHRAARVGVYWPAAGFMMGLGFLCKYTNALQLLSLVLLLVCSRRWRPLLLKPGPYVMLAAFAVCLIPVLLWNAGNDWITVTHLKERGSLDEGGVSINPLEWLTFTAGHLFVYSPVIFVGLVWAVVLGTKRIGAGNGEAFLVAFALPILVLYFALSFKEAGELNWTAPGFISAAALLPFYWRSSSLAGRWRIGLQSTALLLGACLSLLVMNTDLVRAVGVRWNYGSDPEVGEMSPASYLKDPASVLENAGDFSGRARGWKASSEHFARWIEAVAADVGEDVFLIANRYQTAAALAFYLPEDLPIINPSPHHPLIFAPESQAPEHQFSFWPSYAEVVEVDQVATEDGDTLRVERSPFRNKVALFVTDDIDRLSPPSAVENAFRECLVVEDVRILRRGRFVRGLKIFACYDYLGSDL